MRHIRRINMISLIVDDNEAITQLMQKMLKNIDPEGTHIAANSAEEALEIIGQEKIQVLFLDIEMPNMSGIEMAQQLQTENPKLNVIFVTGHPEYAYQAHKVHCCGFLSKPFDEHDIVGELERLRPQNQRIPVEYGRPEITVLCGEDYRINGEDAREFFQRDKTHELFAYLLYRKGAICSNDEIISVLFGDAGGKKDILRKYIQDMRAKLREFHAEDSMIKRYGMNQANLEI